jgi:uncharacterized membrane protein YgdD (TMEM256/DUF423 family)
MEVLLCVVSVYLIVDVDVVTVGCNWKMKSSIYILKLLKFKLGNFYLGWTGQFLAFGLAVFKGTLRDLGFGLYSC